MKKIGSYPATRLRRNRKKDWTRRLVEEHSLSTNDLIWPIFLTEGKNKEIRRIFRYFDNRIKKIHRYEFAGIKLGNIKSGKYKRINYKDFNKFLITKKNNKCI